MTQTLDPPAAAGNGQTAVARRADYQPLAPVGTPGALKSLIDTQRDGLAAMLPKHITPERLLKTLLVATNRNPDILKCTQASILETINRAAELGLDLSGTLGEAYPVPFNNKVKWKDEGGRDREEYRMQLQLVIGYRGMEKLAWQSGEVQSVDAEVVHANDPFEFRKGTEVKVSWSPCLTGDRGPVVGAYACLTLKSGGRLARFLLLADIEKIRASSKSKDSPAWRNWWEEMARKCALKRVLKDAPLSTEKLTRAMDTDGDDRLSDVLSAMTGGPVDRARRLLDAAPPATQRPVSEGQTFEPESDQPPPRDEPDVSGHGSDERPADLPPDVSTWENTEAALIDAAMTANMPEEELKKVVRAWALAKGCKGDASKIVNHTTQAERLAIVEAIRAGVAVVNGRIVTPE